MAQRFTGAINFPTNFDVRDTSPLDVRLVVENKESLIDGSIKYPYQGMVVNIAGTSELWILTTQGIEESHNPENWKLVTGTGGGNNLSKYQIPVMTTEMVLSATEDSDIDFGSSEDEYILVDHDGESLSGETTNNTVTSVNGTYLDIMMRAIRDLQCEVARLKNSFDYGIDSYQNKRTAKSNVLSDYAGVTGREPLWAIDPGYLSAVENTINFNTYLDGDNLNSFEKIGDCVVDYSVDGQLIFKNGKAKFKDGDSNGENLTLYSQKDSKQIVYLVTDKPTISMDVVSVDDKLVTKTIDFEPYLNSVEVNTYGFCIVISRKVKNFKNDTNKGFNYIYFSIINYENDNKLCEGYWSPDSDNQLSNIRVDLNDRYSVQSLTFDRLTLYRMKFYTKYEDFSEEVISSAPSESDWKYDVAHITIRAVDDTSVLNEVKDQLRENELIWNKKSGTLHIKSNNKIHLIGSNKVNNENNNTNDTMTDKEIIDALYKMGIIVNVEYERDTNGVETETIASIKNMSLSPISDFAFVNNETGKKFTYTVDAEGNLVGRDNSAETIDEFNKKRGTSIFRVDGVDTRVSYDGTTKNYAAVRGFISDYLHRLSGINILSDGVNSQKDTGKMSDRLRFSSFYAPISTDKAHGCTHSFVELENTSDVDIPLTGMYLHFYNPVAIHNNDDTYSGYVYHLALNGVIPAGGTYLIRGAKHAEFDDASAFIKVKTFDQEWYYNGEPVSFEQMPVKTTNTIKDNKTVKVCAEDSKIKTAYRFCLTYQYPNLDASTTLCAVVEGTSIDGNTYDGSKFQNVIKDPRFIDSCSFSTLLTVASQTAPNNTWYINGKSGNGIEIVENSMFRLMFALDPAKQAFNGFNMTDSSRIRYNKTTDLQILTLNKEFIGFPHSKETIRIDRYTPKASFEHRNVMTDKTQLNFEKPNMVTCSLGNDVYNTRCFNWISCGVFDEYVWIRKQGDANWKKFQSYTNISGEVAESNEEIHRKEYTPLVNNAVYARIIDRFPGNDVLFTSHKCVVVLPDAATTPVKYEYVVGRPDKDGNPDLNHVNDTYTFTLYPRTYEGRVYQITDQQGFHWIEYQVWAAAAEFLNKKIEQECNAINSDASKTKVFPILINTGDMTQSGARINEWLDYYNGGISLFNHLEQINCVGNNDLCDINPRNLGTGNDNNKSNSRFFHYFYCFDVKDDEACNCVADNMKKFFNGETLVVKKNTNTTEDRYIPSFYYFKTEKVMYIIVNSEIPENGVANWFGLKKGTGNDVVTINIYTGIESKNNGVYDVTTQPFTPLYETMYAWLNENQTSLNSKKVVVAMHEMPFTVITNDSLTNKNGDYLKSTRNHPNGAAARVGSNVNQLNLKENRGIYWMSRLLEYFGCKIVIGGHKHTYALSYPIKEKYSWTYNGVTNDSIDEIKPMSDTLADEAGENPTYDVNWIIEYTDENPYKISDSVKVENRKLNSTKTPYIPESLYNNFGKGTFESSTDVIRCCTPTTWHDDANKKYDGYITYSMCQATGYKLKSNKELPSPLQLFSKIIPVTSVADSKPDGAQLYPMYSVLEFNNDCTELDVNMVRISGIFKAKNKDEFLQNSYGTGNMDDEYLCTDELVTIKDGIEERRAPMYGSWVAYNKINPNNIYLHIKF